MAHNIVDWQTRSEALVALIDDTMVLRHIMWIDPGEDSRGIAAHGGDTFAVANEQGRLLTSTRCQSSTPEAARRDMR